jgi:hypothetical protein
MVFNRIITYSKVQLGLWYSNYCKLIRIKPLNLIKPLIKSRKLIKSLIKSLKLINTSIFGQIDLQT